MQAIQQSPVSDKCVPDVDLALSGEAWGAHLFLCRDISASGGQPPGVPQAPGIPWGWNLDAHREHDYALPRLWHFGSGLDSWLRSINDYYERSGAMKDNHWLSSRVSHAVAVAPAACGFMHNKLPLVCPFPIHYHTGFLEESAHFEGVRGFDSQDCAGPGAAYSSRSHFCVSAFAMHTPEGSVCLSAASGLTGL